MTIAQFDGLLRVPMMHTTSDLRGASHFKAEDAASLNACWAVNETTSGPMLSGAVSR